MHSKRLKLGQGDYSKLQIIFYELENGIRSTHELLATNFFISKDISHRVVTAVTNNWWIIQVV